MTGTVGSWSGASSYSQQWQRCTGATCNPIAQRDRVDVCAGRGRCRLHPAAPGHGQQHGRPQPARQLGPDSGCGRARRRRDGRDGLVHAGRRADVGDGLVDHELVRRLQLPARDQRQPGRLPGRQKRRLPPILDAPTTSPTRSAPSPPQRSRPKAARSTSAPGSKTAAASQAVLYEGAWLRHTAGPDTFYIVRRASNGNWTTVATINGPDIAVGDQLAFKLAGTSLSLHRKPAGSSSWTQILAATDTTITGPGRLGLELYNATGAKADDWTISPDLPGSSSPSVPLNTALPTVSGTAQVGQTLTGTVGTWTGATSFAQQWQRCSGASCNPIANATALTYVPVAADVGFTLRLQVTASNTAGPSLPATSAQTAAVIAATGSVPVNTGLPTVTGTAQVGQTLTGTVGTWTRRQQLQPAVAALQGATCNPISNATA